MAAKFTVSTGKDGKHYFNLHSTNGQVILSSQGYKDKSDCMNGIESVKRNSSEEGRFEVKKSGDDRDYFVLTATNGQTIGKSQMYKASADCKNGISSVMKNASEAQIADQEAQ